jgi:RimJ/RimL family protein N-acetyltransferase
MTFQHRYVNQKIGFKHFGTRRKALLRDMKRHDVLSMDIVPEDFYAQLDNEKCT